MDTSTNLQRKVKIYGEKYWNKEKNTKVWLKLPFYCSRIFYNIQIHWKRGIHDFFYNTEAWLQRCKYQYFPIMENVSVVLYFRILHQRYKTPYFRITDLFTLFLSFISVFYYTDIQSSVFPFYGLQKYGNYGNMESRSFITLTLCP